MTESQGEKTGILAKKSPDDARGLSSRGAPIRDLVLTRPQTPHPFLVFAIHQSLITSHGSSRFHSVLILYGIYSLEPPVVGWIRGKSRERTLSRRSLRSGEEENSLLGLVFSPHLVFSLFRSYQTLDPKPQTRSSLVLSLNLVLSLILNQERGREASELGTWAQRTETALLLSKVGNQLQ